MDDLYSLSDIAIRQRIGARIKHVRLKQNITQANLAIEAQVSLSTVKKVESGEIGSFDSFLRIMRTLNMLEDLQPLLAEDQISPTEYYNLVHSIKKSERKRAAGTIRHIDKEESEW